MSLTMREQVLFLEAKPSYLRLVFYFTSIMRILITTSFCFLFFFTLSAQESEKVVLTKNKIDTASSVQKIFLYSDLCYYYRYTSQDSATKYGNLAIELARQLNNPKGEAQGMNDLGIIKADQNEFDEALKLYQKSLVIRMDLNDSMGQASLYNKIGIVYQKQGNLDKALENQLTALRYYDRLNQKYGIAQCLNNVAIVYYNQNLYEQSLEYYQKSVDVKKEIGDRFGVAGSLSNIANIYYSQKKLDLAIEKNLEAISYLRELNASEYLAGALNNLGTYYMEKQDLKKAKEVILESLSIRKEIGDRHGEASSYANLGNISLDLEDYNSAKNYLDQALEIASSDGIKLKLIDIYASYTLLYISTGQKQLALEYFEKRIVLGDSIHGEESIAKILELQTQYETEKKEQEIKLLAAENALKDSEIANANNRFYASMGGAGMLMILAFTLFNRYKHKQRALLAEEKALNQKLGFKSLIEGEEKERKRIAQELHDGLGQLLSSARLNVSAMEDQVNEIVTTQWKNSIKLIDDAVTEVRSISHNMMPNALISIGFEAALKEQIHIINDAGLVQVHTEFPEEKINLPEAEAIALYRVIQEILNNALKYSEAKNIWLTIYSDNEIGVKIKDDGRGFDTKVVQDSTGIGWQNIQSRVDILNGKLNINSEIGKGSEISLKMAV